MRPIAIFFGFLLFLCAFGAGVTFWTQDHETQSFDLRKAEELIEANHANEALPIIQNYRPEMETLSKNGLKWLDLFIKASEQERDIPQLLVLFDFFPESFKVHEAASLLVADHFITSNQVNEYQTIRSLWNNRETKAATWLLLDSDLLLLQGRKKEAIDQLKSFSFDGHSDMERLTRLALLYVDDDPQTSWNYLTEAYQKEPQNTDIRSYRARFLENIGKNSLAHQEYQAATRLHPDDLYLKDQLAEFYIRQKKYPQALKVWKESPNLENALFWSRVAQPTDFNWKNESTDEPLIAYLINLKPNTFWDERSFQQIPGNKFYLRSEQSTYWLRLLQALKEGHEKEAWSLLSYNPFSLSSWDPKLEETLKWVLTYRRENTFTPGDTPFMVSEESLSESSFFDQLETIVNQTEIPKEIHELLLSDEAFTAVFLEAGWDEAALKMHTLSVIPDQFPEWFSYNLAQAYRKNRGNRKALQFAKRQKEHPQMQLLIGELQIAEGNPEAGLNQLKSLTAEGAEIGYRSSWLVSLLYIEQEDYGSAKTTILNHPRLSQEVLGQETLARIALLEEDTATANRIYTSLEKESAEARSYLAKKAFAEKNWPRARELTEQLIKDYPNNPILRENLKKIPKNKY